MAEGAIPGGDASDGPVDEAGRPIRLLPNAQLIQISLYWFGLSAIFAGLNIINQERIKTLASPENAGFALGMLGFFGVAIAIVVQPTIGSISDYTISRWGRRKPYIVIGSILDLFFLVGIAYSQTYLTVAAFLVLLQFSSNFAQGPFQGYVPDLVPARQVGVASALVGLMQVLGNVGGFLIGSIALITGNYVIPTIALGAVELLTMIGVVLWVDEGRVAKPRNGRSWTTIAREAWGLDILQERSYVFLVISRLFVLMGGSVIVNLALFYLERSLGFTTPEAGKWFIVTLILIAVVTVTAAIPAARLSDRVGRKRIIYASCGAGVVAMLAAAVAPSIAVTLVGVALFGFSAGTFLAVDWALMTDIIPKASSGRYMGLSNVATASAGILATLIAGRVMDVVSGPTLSGEGPRAAMVVAACFFGIGALFLRPVDERRRELEVTELEVAELETATA